MWLYFSSALYSERAPQVFSTNIHMSAVRNDEKLWQSVKRKLLKEGEWNARMAQRAVKIYKDKGGTYSNKVPRNKTSLNKWTKEEWDYAGEPKKSRYLPKKVRKSLTDTETRRENRRKSSRLGQKVPYSESVKKKMKAAKIF